jgi:G:T-mismatch repair DNA endonuclease (very short patch repair protein)
MKNGNICCSKSHNSCPAVRRRKSRSLKGTRVGEDNPFYGMKHTDKFKEGRRREMLGDKNPCYRKVYSKKERLKMSKSVKKAWSDKKLLQDAIERGINNFKDEGFLKKFLKGCRTKPNNHEKKLIDLFSKLDVDFDYVGDFKVWIGGKNPDFINYNEKKIIEYFGLYWHKKEDEERTKHFEQFGYKTLIIWEYELDDPIILKQKIFQFSME